jgi:hypothetical protein
MAEEQIRNLIARYLANQIDKAAFSQSFAGLYFRVRNNREESLAARRLCSEIVLPFAELSRGHRTEQSFREELAKAVRPFVQQLPRAAYGTVGPMGTIVASSSPISSVIAFRIAGLDANAVPVASEPSKKTASAIVQRAEMEREFAVA